MRYQDALLLQKQQAEKDERHREAQRQLEEVAAKVDVQYNYWLNFRDPFAESQQRIEALLSPMREATLNGSSGEASRSNTSVHGIPLPSNGSGQSLEQSGTREPSVRHMSATSDLDPTAFSLYRKLKQAQ